MGILLGGRERSPAQLAALASSAGYRVVARYPAGPMAITELVAA